MWALGWTQPYTHRMVSLSVNHFWAHRNPAGKPTPPQKMLIFHEKGRFFANVQYYISK